MTGGALGLARAEFGVTAAVHFLFAALTLGLLPVVAVFQTRWVLTGRDELRRMTTFWGNLYVINYALGIITGLVMEFQFGLNWSGLSRMVGNLFGAPLALETIIAFFAESTFLGLWILGWNRLPKWVHLALVWLLTLTAYASSYFVMVANGFLQHPVGFALRGGQITLTDWGALLTNPGTVHGLVHLLSGALASGGFFMVGVCAYHFARKTEHREFFDRSLRVGLVVAAGGSLLTVAFGINQFNYLGGAQPAKLAAITGSAAGLAKAQAAAVARYGPGDYLPPGWVDPSAKAMMAIGVVLGVLALAALFFRAQFFRPRPVLWGLVAVVPLPFLALVLGWVVREEGRQPWLVYGIEHTSSAGSSVTTGEVLASLIGFTVCYLALAVVNYRMLARAARKGPHDGVFGELGES